ncbi:MULTISPECIES: ABC transporter ATP-binding protein [Rhodococcus]|uniref:ABC transporter ATP-binding protein n=1 Tax=Rhodococcus TaxID=1827 RepID=UPI001639A642|nr:MULTISPECIES: ABC transporter ATP-binding protein [Rhodococcus]MBC2590687.1 ABC transporter ATP-binding protein [Rhodococcus aetherivorans]QRI74998.1 ABC transporter ATP-binding protein [Rhodococcus aetherivorans]QSE58408.1 ABC transporter ATP-binding protein [Rhodococcus sp. PSBB066]QSE70271.1 ABC transporter ATP-binding protein [Rhodococcus sp. PSBB049]
MNAVTVTGVHKAFGARTVLDGAEFAVAEGEFVSLIGPSGCGKSTLFGLIAGLDSPDTGAVTVGDRPAAPGRAALMPQKDLLFPWRTVLGNCALGLEVQGVPRGEARARARELFPAFGLAGFEDAAPRQLSGGMRQRAALARTVLQGHKVLLLDEPFGALDSLTRTEMQLWLQQVWQRDRWTVLMITHDVREALLLSDRVLVLTRRPARICHEVTVPLPRPRGLDTLTSPEFVTLEKELVDVLHATGPRSSALPD